MSPVPDHQELSQKALEQQKLEEATQELRLLETLVPQGAVGFPSFKSPGARDMEVDLQDQHHREDDQDADRPPKWQKPESKGQGGRGKGQNQRQPAKPFGKSWGNQHSSHSDRWAQEADSWTTDSRQGNMQKELQQLRTRVDLLTTLLLRHDNQLAILRLDTAFMLFIRTDAKGNLAALLYQTGLKWKQAKEQDPTKLESPMRVVLVQALLSTVASRFEQLMATQETRANAIQLGWLNEDATLLHNMKWDSEAKKHVINPMGNSLDPKKALSMVKELVILCKADLVVNRFHATRPITQEIESSVLPMMLDVGLRSQEADKAWLLLKDLCGSAIWLAAGVNMRPDRLQRGPLAQRLALLMEKSR